MAERASRFLSMIHRITRPPRNCDRTLLPRAEFFALNVIYDCAIATTSEITVLQLAEIMEKTPAATSKILRVMESKGYINRKCCGEDRRRVYISLTKDGRRIIDDARTQANERCEELFSRLGEHDTHELLRIVERIYQIQQQSCGKDDTII